MTLRQKTFSAQYAGKTVSSGSPTANTFISGPLFRESRTGKTGACGRRLHIRGAAAITRIIPSLSMGNFLDSSRAYRFITILAISRTHHGNVKPRLPYNPKGESPHARQSGSTP